MRFRMSGDTVSPFSLIAVPILAPSMMPDVWKGDVMADVIDVLPPPPRSIELVIA